jgi:hypothetical protein
MLKHAVAFYKNLFGEEASEGLKLDEDFLGSRGEGYLRGESNT